MFLLSSPSEGPQHRPASFPSTASTCCFQTRWAFSSADFIIKLAHGSPPTLLSLEQTQSLFFVFLVCYFVLLSSFSLWLANVNVKWRRCKKLPTPDWNPRGLESKNFDVNDKFLRTQRTEVGVRGKLDLGIWLFWFRHKRSSCQGLGSWLWGQEMGSWLWTLLSLGYNNVVQVFLASLNILLTWPYALIFGLDTMVYETNRKSKTDLE